jgi:hypothetical protein
MSFQSMEAQRVACIQKFTPGYSFVDTIIADFDFRQLFLLKIKRLFYTLPAFGAGVKLAV